jgi:hypothetical protein
MFLPPLNNKAVEKLAFTNWTGEFKNCRMKKYFSCFATPPLGEMSVSGLSGD